MRLTIDIKCASWPRSGISNAILEYPANMWDLELERLIYEQQRNLILAYGAKHAVFDVV